MEIGATLARIKTPLAVVVLLGTVGAWLLVFQSGWQSGDWAGFWFSAQDLRGDKVDIQDKRVETPLEREKRLGITGKHVNESLYEAKKKILGERGETRGDTVERNRGYVPKMYRASEREACIEMQMEFPERYKDVDCLSSEYSDEPWLPGVPPADDDDDDDKAKAAPPADDPAWPPGMRRSPLGRPAPVPKEAHDPLLAPRRTDPAPGAYDPLLAPTADPTPGAYDPLLAPRTPDADDRGTEDRSP